LSNSHIVIIRDKKTIYINKYRIILRINQVWFQIDNWVYNQSFGL